MSKYKIEGNINKFIDDKIEASDLETAIKIFRETYPDAQIIWIDGKEVVGFCEDSGMPIFDGDDYSEDENGIMWLNQQ